MSKEAGEIRFVVHEFDGYRLIEALFPPRVDSSKLSLATAAYMLLWESNEPTVQINDVSLTDPFDETASSVLVSILKRNAIRPNYIASVYWIGENVLFEDSLRAILTDAGRSIDCIFRHREDALAYLSSRTEDYQSRMLETAPDSEPWNPPTG